MATPQNWRVYETVIHDRLKELAGVDADVAFDRRLMGRVSATDRQVDVVVRGGFPGLSPGLRGGEVVTMVVDCKCWNRRVSLPEADRFAGFVEDLGVPLALLVTSKGCTAAAERRIGGIRGAFVDLVAPEEITHAFSAYCVKCRARVNVVGVVELTMSNRRPAARGTCPVCRAKLFKIGKTHSVRPAIRTTA